MGIAVKMMNEPVRVTVNGTSQELRLAVDVEPFNKLELAITVYEGTDADVKLVTGMNLDSEDGWVDLASFPANLDAPSTTKQTFSNPLRYIRWNVIDRGTTGAVTFMIWGVARLT